MMKIIKKILCKVFGHKWITAPLLTAFLRTGKEKTTFVYMCKNCDKTITDNGKDFSLQFDKTNQAR